MARSNARTGRNGAVLAAAFAGVIAAVSACSPPAAQQANSVAPAPVVEAMICVQSEVDCVKVPDPHNYVIDLYETPTPSPESSAASPAPVDNPSPAGSPSSTSVARYPLTAAGTVTLPAGSAGRATIRLQCVGPKGSASCDPETGFGSTGIAGDTQTVYWLAKEYK